MKGLLRGIGYFLLYIVFTIAVQVVLSIVAVQIAPGMGITGQTQIEDFVNKNILGMTIVSGLLTVLFLYLWFKIPKKDIRKEWNLNSFAFRDLIKACLLSFSLSSVFSLLTLNVDIENSRLITDSAQYYSSMVPYMGTILMVLNLLVIAPAVEEAQPSQMRLFRISQLGNHQSAVEQRLPRRDHSQYQGFRRGFRGRFVLFPSYQKQENAGFPAMLRDKKHTA